MEPGELKLIFTIGHSTHPIEEFLSLLGQHEIRSLVDVRSFPTSKRWPHFNQDELQRSTGRAGIEYLWLKSLGGRRHGSAPDSPHASWRIAAFRSYADYAEGDEFKQGLAKLIALAERERTAYMCAEGLWWRCHRRIISDHIVVRGWIVMHIMPTGKLSEHRLPDFARVSEDRIIYDQVSEK